MKLPRVSFPLVARLTVALLTLTLLRAEPPAGWRQVFADEFDGRGLDATKWGTTMAFAGIQGPRYHNEYYASYTVDEDVMVEEGTLRLRTDRRAVTGEEPPGTFQFTQGLVSTDRKFAFTYGYVEIRAKFPGGRGLWPCFWLMPQHQSWPPEFDIAEYYGGQRKMHHGLAHGVMHDPQWDSTGDSETEFENVWHTFALEWGPGSATWFVDGIVRKKVTASYVPDCAMYVILSNSVSSRRGPSNEPDEKTIFPNFFEIDYVRVYQPVAPVATETVVAKNEVTGSEADKAEIRAE